MKRKGGKKKNLVSVFAMVCIVIVSSALPVYAANYNEDMVDVDIKCFGTSNMMDINGLFLYPTETDEQYVELLQPVTGHEYYILKDGQQISWNETSKKERWGCSHTKVAVSVSDHIKYSDGSCLTILYDAQLCTKCGGVWKGEETGRMSLKNCPH